MATTALRVELNKKTDNPFYGLANCLELYQNAGKGVVTEVALNSCWNEVKNNKVKKEMFFSLLFSIGDITARQHNIFNNTKVDSGGNSQREAFRIIIDWIKRTNYSQFKRFLFARLFNEYSSFDSLFANRVQTTKKKKTVVKVLRSLSGTKEYLNDLADFCVQIINGNNPANKYFLAKFLTRPRVSKRKNHKAMLKETLNVMKQKEFFLKLVSIKAGLRFFKKDTHTEFFGYIDWRKEYIGDLESVLFSSKKVLEFDKQEFLAWLDKLPASARHRVRCKLLNEKNEMKGTKWGNIPNWFLEWESFKEGKQTEVRVIEEELRQETGRSLSARTELEQKLKTVKKEAKVTVGSVNFAEMFTEIVKGNVDKLKIQPFLDKINLPYNTLVFMDDSSSMQSAVGDYGFSAFDFAAFMATIVLTKNPDDTGRSLLGFYSKDCRMFQTMSSTSEFSNSIIRRSNVRKINEPLINPELHFLDNLQRMRAFSNSIRTSNSTNIGSIPEYLTRWINGDAELLEQLQMFPVWTIITDGNWNSMGSAEASINDFMMKCQRYFGYKPFIIAIDVARGSSANITKFQGIDNFMFVPPNPAQIEQLLTNFKDMDIMDVYTPLQSLFRSNRYSLVRANVI